MRFIEETDHEGECTGYIVAGMAGGGTTFLHKNRDSSAWREGVVILDDGDGHRSVLVQQATGVTSEGFGKSAVSAINVKGVAGATFAGFTSEPKVENPISPSGACVLALRAADTAEDYVRRFGEIVEDRGLKGGISGAVSPGQGWRIEYGGHRYAIDGPYVDDYSPIANVYTITSMKGYEVGGWQRQGRLRKSRALLEAKLYPNAPGKPWFGSWTIADAFDFARNQDPIPCPICSSPRFEKGAHAGSVAGGSDPRPICDGLPWGRPGRCVSAHIAIPDDEHPAFLTTLWWNIDRPTNSPFIPLFSGLTKVPDAIAANPDPDGAFPAADLLDELRKLAYEYEGSLDLVDRVWTAFETRQHRAVVDDIQPAVRAHLAAGDEAAAHDVLDTFVADRVDEVMDLTTKLIHKLRTEAEALLLPSV